MSVEKDRIEIMRRAEAAIRPWVQQMEDLEPLMKNKTGVTCLDVATGRLNGFLVWIRVAINCEKEFDEKGGKE